MAVKEKRSSVQQVQVVPSGDRFEALCRDCIGRFPKKFRSKFKVTPFAKWQTKIVASDIIAFCTARDLKDTPNLGGNARYLVFTEGLPVEALASRLLQLGVKSAKRLHLAHETEKEEVDGVVFRLLAGSANGTPRIVDAWLEPNALVLLSPSFERMSIPLGLLEKFIGKNRKKIASFEIDEDGSFLYWPHADVHMGWEQFQCLIDPHARLRQRQELDGYNERYGAAIRSLREETDLTQSDIAGINDRTLRRVEQGKASASSTTLESLAKAHKMSLNDYMQAVAEHVN